MNPWMDTWGRLTVLLEKYGLEIPLLAQAESPAMRVPVIGPFSAGKSSLLNALTGMELLPVGITATTAFPTELCFGDNAVLAHRNGAVQAMGLGELRGIDPAGVTRLEVRCDLAFLLRIPRLLLVDTPGLDSTQAHEALLRDELKSCGGCIAVFPADDPVMKPGAAAALSALPAGTPVMAFVNKCDKLLPGELDASVDFLQASLRKLPGLEDCAVNRVSASQNDVEPLRRAVLDLEKRAERQDGVSCAIRQTAASLRRYLCLRLDAAELRDASEAERVKAVRDRMDRLRGSMEEERSRFHQRMRECLRRTDEQMRTSVDEIALPVETLLNAGKDPTSYVEDFFRELITSCYRRDFWPDAKSCLDAIGALMRLREHPEASEAASGDTFPPSALDLVIKDDPFPEASDLLSQALLSLNCLTRSKRREAAKRMTASLLPALGQIAGKAAADMLRTQAERLRRELEQALLREETLVEKAYLTVPGHPEETAALKADIKSLDAILSCLTPA